MFRYPENEHTTQKKIKENTIRSKIYVRMNHLVYGFVNDRHYKRRCYSDTLFFTSEPPFKSET